MLGSARNVENGREESQGSRCCWGSLGRDAPCIPGGPTRLPRQRWCVPTGRETGDRKLWPVFVWHRRCPVLDLCRDESRTDTTSAHLVETYLRTCGTICYPSSSSESKIPVSLFVLAKRWDEMRASSYVLATFSSRLCKVGKKRKGF